MKRYRIIDGIPVPPPKNGVDKNGNVISNFAARIESDAAFASQNGYYPMADTPIEEFLSLETKPPIFVLKNGEWVRQHQCKP